MAEIERYLHRWTEERYSDVAVIKGLRGKHKEHCLCWQGCANFKPNTPAENCAIAQALYRFDVQWSIVTPVWECPKYEETNEG